MKRISKMTQGEFGAFVQSRLREKEIEVVLSGGAAVAIHSDNKYVSKDLDLINIYGVHRRKIRDVMTTMGFYEEGRYFSHPDSQFFVEFPPGPLAIGQEHIRQPVEKKYSTGVLKVISPTDCVKDRLAAYYHWGDQQSLLQAILVTQKTRLTLMRLEDGLWQRGNLRSLKE